MATTALYRETLKSSSPEPINRWPWNLVCSNFVRKCYQDYSNYDTRLILTYFTPSSNLVSLAFVWENWKLLFFCNHCSLSSQSWLKHSPKWDNEGKWVSKVKVIVWSWAKVTQISKLNLFCSDTVGSFEIKLHMKAYGRMWMITDTYVLCYMTEFGRHDQIWGKYLNDFFSRTSCLIAFKYDT